MVQDQQQQLQRNVHTQRQRQYLHAMGIDVYIDKNCTDQPIDTDSVVDAPVQKQPVPAAVSNVDAAVVKPDLSQDAVMRQPAAALTDSWTNLENQVKDCTACELSQARTQSVFGVGDYNADWLIIGESPNVDEDKQGEPFIGETGQLVNKMLQAIGLQREQVYITNLVKCHSANSPHPKANQVTQCNHFLQQEIALVKPKIILVFSKLAAQSLLKTEASVAQMRGQQHQYGEQKIPLIVTYHPAYLLRAPGEKKKSWNDLKLASGIYKELLK